MRRTLVSRSSRENPSPCRQVRPHHVAVEHRDLAAELRGAARSGCLPWSLLPDPERPVNQTQTPPSEPRTVTEPRLAPDATLKMSLFVWIVPCPWSPRPSACCTRSGRRSPPDLRRGLALRRPLRRGPPPSRSRSASLVWIDAGRLAGARSSGPRRALRSAAERRRASRALRPGAPRPRRCTAWRSRRSPHRAPPARLDLADPIGRGRDALLEEDHVVAELALHRPDDVARLEVACC